MKLKLTLIMSGILAVSGCGGGDDEKTLPSTTLPNNTTDVAGDPASGLTDSSAYNDYGVHDPSVIKIEGTGGEEDTYYVFGSHLGAASTTDLMNWSDISNITDGDITTTTLFDDFTAEMAEGIDWVDGYVGSWASDVIQAPNGKYWFYYNHCANTEAEGGCWNRSYLGLAEADNVEGPYVNRGVFLRSGYREAAELEAYPVYDPATESNITAWNGAIHPNVIDPAAFYDKDDNLWMVYGSYSGGIFVLALDEETGMPEPNQGYGKHLVGGDYNAIEGSFVMYSEETNYYYLFWSNGGFNAADGYNIRVARSRTPDGPYLDAAGNDMVNARVPNDMGVKLMGGFNFKAAFADTEAEWGYRSPGHNSALYDEDLGKYLLFTHTRFPLDQVPFEQYHAVRIHEMWMNEDDWLVASPHRYAPTAGENVVDYIDLVGDYRIVMHGKDTNTEVNESYYVSLSEQGRYITGQLSGSYKLFGETNRIQVIIDGEIFEGVMQWQWNTKSERFDPAISALSSTGEALWAVKMEEKSNSDIVGDIVAAMPIPDLLAQTSLDVPVVATNGTEIQWATSNRSYVRLPREFDEEAETITNTVVRPAFGSGDQTVTLTATIIRDGVEIGNHGFDVVVPARVQNNRVAHYGFDDNLTETLGNLAEATTVGTRPYLDGAIAYGEGVNGQAASLDGTGGVRFPANLITNYEYTVSYWMRPTAIFNFRASFFGAVDEFPVVLDGGETIYFADRWVNFLPANWDGQAHFWSHNFIPDVVDNWYDGFTGTTLTPDEWVHVAFAVNNGNVNAYLNGVQVATASNLPDYYSRRADDAVFTFGVNYWDDPFLGLVDDMKIYDAAISAAEVEVLDINGDVAPVSEKLEIAMNQLDLGDITALTSDIDLVNHGAFASAVSWVSSDESVIDTIGYVTRPSRESTDALITLTATISLDGESVTKEFNALVLADVPPVPVARYSFEENLSDSVGNFGDGYAAMRGTDAIPAADVAESYAAGVLGNALSMTGEGSTGVRFDEDLISDYSYGIAFWVNPTALTAHTPSFAGFGTGAAYAAKWMNFVLSGWWSDQSAVWTDNAGQVYHDFGMVAPVGEWTHIAYSVDQGTDKVWVNGELVHEGDDAPDLFSDDDTRFFTIGLNWWDTPYNGLFDELVIYDSPISQEEVDGLIAETTAGE